MAKLVIIGAILLLSIFFISIIPSGHAREQVPDPEKNWFQNICHGNNEKLARLHFYVQDVLGGENATVYEVARASITPDSPTMFGLVRVLDNLITALPDKNSEKLGRLQGLITCADLETTALAMNLNCVFTSGDYYNGSTISILGRNQITNEERELPVVGGTGIFRFARGYAILKTYSHDPVTNNGVLEYTIYVTYVETSNSSMGDLEADM